MARSKDLPANPHSAVPENKLEWIGGVLVLPTHVTELRDTVDPALAIWMELPSNQVLAHEIVVDEEKTGALAQLLRQALERPISGPQRRPSRIRVATDYLAQEAYFALDSDLPIVVAPTPELDAFLEAFLAEQEHLEPDEDEEDLNAWRSAGRNDLCPCGSGRKFKRCHLGEIQQAERARLKTESLMDLDWRVSKALKAFAMTELDSSDRAVGREFQALLDAPSLAIPSVFFDLPLNEETIAQKYVKRYGENFSAEEHSWLRSQEAAAASVWTITGVTRGMSLELLNPLSQATRVVYDSGLSRNRVVGHAILARIVDHDDCAVLCGLHPVLLSPQECDELVRRARGHLRRKGAVPAERLRRPEFLRYLARRWSELVAETDGMPPTRPKRKAPKRKRRSRDAEQLSFDF